MTSRHCYDVSRYWLIICGFPRVAGLVASVFLREASLYVGLWVRDALFPRRRLQRIASPGISTRSGLHYSQCWCGDYALGLRVVLRFMYTAEEVYAFYVSSSTA